MPPLQADIRTRGHLQTFPCPKLLPDALFTIFIRTVRIFVPLSSQPACGSAMRSSVRSFILLLRCTTLILTAIFSLSNKLP